MAPLPNVRHEKFVQALFAGKSATESYALAGYKPHQGNSSRLRWFEMVQSRLAELQGDAARSTKVTLESVCRELDDAMAVAKSKHQAQAMVSASSMKAKLNGLLTERIEIGKPGEFDGLTSTAAIVDSYLEQVIDKFRPIDQADREALLAMFKTFFAEVEEFIAGLNARPVLAERADQRRLDRPWQELEIRNPPARLRSNGSTR